MPDADLLAALEQLVAECRVPIDFYERNGPTWTSSSGHEYEDTSYVLAKMEELSAIAKAAIAKARPA